MNWMELTWCSCLHHSNVKKVLFYCLRKVGQLQWRRPINCHWKFNGTSKTLVFSMTAKQLLLEDKHRGPKLGPKQRKSSCICWRVCGWTSRGFERQQKRTYGLGPWWLVAQPHQKPRQFVNDPWADGFNSQFCLLTKILNVCLSVVCSTESCWTAHQYLAIRRHYLFQ